MQQHDATDTAADRMQTNKQRVLMLDASASEPDHLYGAIEVGGTIRSTDGGEHWENLSHGQYVNDDMVDMHGVLASRWRPGTVFGLFLVFYGLFRSTAEFFREPHAGHPLDIGLLTPGIIYSIPMMLIGAWLIWRARREPALAA